MNAIDFIHDLSWDDIPTEGRHQAVRCLFDTIGTAIGGRQTALSAIIYKYVSRVYGERGGEGQGTARYYPLA